MFKFILFLAGIAALGVLIATDTGLMAVRGFGYEATFSSILLPVGLLLILYLIYLIKKPFQWLEKWNEWRAGKRQAKKDIFMRLVLKTLLDKNEAAAALILKNRKSWFAKDSAEFLLLEALFSPTPAVFEKLLRRDGTELAGIRGLLGAAQKKGDLHESELLLQQAAETTPRVSWIYEAQWTLQTLQNDWREALKTLDILKKKKLLSAAEYAQKRACVLLKLDRAKEAFSWDNAHAAAAIRWAQQEPERALRILEKSWRETPCWETFLAYRAALDGKKDSQKMKAVEGLVRFHPAHKSAVLALAQTAVDAQLWGVAKETLQVYMKSYPLTQTAAQLMAQAERGGWQHEEEARGWEEKGAQALEKSGWTCGACRHITRTWDAVCPICNAFGKINPQ